ncbi:MAG: hypothetical protein KGJ78_06630 [Alphaproteobacteria bacterium]|nr:hypothetical protein [Alphaproteobacteria bacterium]
MRKLMIVVPALALAFAAPAFAGKAVVKSTSTQNPPPSTPGFPACDAGSKDPALTARNGQGGAPKTNAMQGGQGSSTPDKAGTGDTHGCPIGRRAHQL